MRREEEPVGVDAAADGGQPRMHAGREDLPGVGAVVEHRQVMPPGRPRTERGQEAAPVGGRQLPLAVVATAQAEAEREERAVECPSQSTR